MEPLSAPDPVSCLGLGGGRVRYDGAAAARGGRLNAPIRLLIVEDHRLLADSLALVIDDDPALSLVADPVDTAEAAVAAATEHRPDVILMDVQLRGPETGIDATRRIKELVPETKVVIISGLGHETLLVEATEAGASGFIDKTEAVEAAISAVKAVAAGEALVDPILLSRLLRQMAVERREQGEAQRLVARLTPREREVLQLIAEGLRNEAIADRLYLSVRTVQKHVQNILNKLSVHSKLEAVAFAAKTGVVSFRP
ncbi:MAG: response regulator [Actinomycetota bacterium]